MFTRRPSHPGNRSAQRSRRLRLEALEDRRLLAAQPAVTLQAPPRVMIGEAIQLEATFDNSHSSDTGFGPFVDLYLPVNGADGVNGVGADGLSFVSAQYLGAPVTTTILTFPNSGGGTGSVLHPYAVNSAGAPLSISGPTGDRLIVMQLPFGSFTAAQPMARIDIGLQMSNLADLGQLLTLRARAGFQYGNDALSNPATDPSLVSDPASAATSWSTVAAIEPTLLELTKTYLGPEDETATGPNFPRQYRIDLDVANGQTITNLDITDRLPNNVQLISVNTITPAGSVTTTPTTPANAPNNQLIVTIPTVAGTAATNDASVTFTYFVPFRDANGQTVIAPSSGDDATSPNHAAALGDWDPIDSRDAAGIDNAAVDAAGPEHVLTPKSIAVQKSVALFNDVDGNGLSPGDTLEYQISFQVSDFFAFQNVVVNDVLSDGQRFDLAFTPQLQVVEHTASTSGNLNAANYSIVDHFTGAITPIAPIDGTQELAFRVSDELIARTGNGILLGGLVPVTGTGGPDPSAAAFDGGPTTGIITFRTIVQERFTDNFPSGDFSVDEGDRLDNLVSISGDVMSYTNVTTTGQSEADTSQTEISVPAGALVKTIYAVNGTTTLPSPLRLSPGDHVTYRLQLTVPTSDFEDLVLSDYLPLPVLNATQITAFSDIVDNTIPTPGTAKFGPSDTLRSVYGGVPILSTDPVSNAVLFDYGDFDMPAGTSRTIDILFTVTASNQPFADGLFLTNIARRSQDTTNTTDFVSDAIVQIELAMPELSIRKGVVATSNSNDTFTPTTVGPVGFSPPGTAGFRASSTIHSNGLSASPINSNAQQLDAGDFVTFAIVVENNGNSRTGAFDISLRDTLPTGFAIPSTGLNLNVSDGTGAAIGFTNLGTGLFDSAGGVQLTDPGPTSAQPDLTDAGALDGYHATSGRNVLIISYDLEVMGTIAPNASLTNTATLFHYAGAEGGPDFTTTDLADPATVQTASINLAKSVTSTNEPTTLNNNVAIGEIVTYTATFSVPEGVANSATWTDVPDSGFSILDILSVTANSADLTTSMVTFDAVRSAASISANGDSMTLNFGTLTNSNRNNAQSESISVQYRVVTLNSAGNNRGTLLNNLATITWTGGADSASAPNVTVVEPELNIRKSIVPATGQATDVFTITLDVEHTAGSNATAFDVVLTDVLPTGLVFAGGLVHSSGDAPSTVSQLGNTITASWNSLPTTSTSQLQFNAQLSGTVQPSQIITNAAVGTWTSLPNDLTSPQSSDATSTERTGSAANPGGSANDYQDTGTAQLTVIAPDLSKSVIATDEPSTSNTNVAIGEIVTYRAVVAIPQSTLTAATLVDTPTPGLAIVDVLSVTADSSITSSLGAFSSIASAANIPTDGSSLTLDFGTLVNADTDSNITERITIEYRAVVLNTTTNDRTDTLDNQATFAWNGSASVQANAADLTIVEPLLRVTVSNGTPATVDAGDVVTFVITVDHLPGSNQTAHDVSLQNLIQSVANHLQYEPGSLAITPTGGPVLTSASDAGGDLNIGWSTFPVGATATITFQARVQNTAPPFTSLVNTAELQWTSLTGSRITPVSSNPLSVERTGNTANPGASANDHLSLDTGSVLTSVPQTLKVVSSTSLVNTGTSQFNGATPDVAIGEQITYTIDVILPEGTNNLQVLDRLPLANGTMEFVSAQVLSVGSNLTIPVGHPIETRDDRDNDNIDDEISLDFGTVLNVPDGVSNGSDVIQLLIAVRVLDATDNGPGQILTNSIVVDYGVGQATATADVEVVAPILQIDKSANPTTGPAGSTATYTLVISHAGASTSDAFELAIRDLLVDPNLVLVPGTVTSTAGTIITGNGPTDATIGINAGSLPLGGTITVTFAARINLALGTAVAINNSSTVTWDSFPGPGGQPGTDNDPATFTTTAPRINLQITKVDFPDPATINGPLRYTLNVVNLGPSTATNVTLVDTLPGTITVTGVTPSQGTANVVGTTLTALLGTLSPNAQATLTIDSTAPPTPQVIDNLASVSANEVDTDPTNNNTSQQTTIVETASVAGRNWVDSDGNGVFGSNEIPLPGVLVTLTGTNDLGQSVTIVTTSLTDGTYAFTDLRPGTYQVTQTQPTLFLDAPDYLGSLGGTTPAKNRFQVTLTPGEDGVNYNFTERGLRSTGLSKRMLLRSSLLASGVAQSAMNNAALDSIFAQLVRNGSADLDGDGNVDQDDFNWMLANLGGQFNWP